MNSPKISLCMIVRDEESNLEACLESIAPYVDEIVIVDTGSVDGTKAIAAQYADTLMDYKWTGDFSAARNYSMDLATGDVLFIMDADERLTHGGENLRRAASGSNFLYGHIYLINRVSQGPFVGDKVLQPRLFLNDSIIRYENAVHNQIMPGIEDFIMSNPYTWVAPKIDTHILHLGYNLAPGAAKEKYAPRIDELKGCITSAKDAEERAYYQFQAGLMIASAQSTAQSVAYWDVIDYEKLSPENRWFAHFTACRVFLKLDELDRATRHVDGMMGVNPEPAALMMAGVILIERGKRIEGLKLYIQAFLNNLVPSRSQRCQLDGQRLLDDLMQFLTDEEAARISGADASAIVDSVRAFQRSLIPNEAIEAIL